MWMPAIEARMGDRVWHIPAVWVGWGPLSGDFARDVVTWEAQQIWGGVVQSSDCPACRAHVEHHHGYYAPIGGE